MKATLRHVLTPPVSYPTSLTGRLANSNAPLHPASASSASTDTSHGRALGFTSSKGSLLGGAASPPIVSFLSLNSTAGHSFTKIKIMEVHPAALPLVAYVDTHIPPEQQDQSNSNAGNHKRSNSRITHTTADQRIVIQDYYRNTVLRTITVSEIAKACLATSIAEREGTKAASAVGAGGAVSISSNAIARAAQSLGAIQSLSFLDRHCIHWITAAGSIPSASKVQQRQESWDCSNTNALIVQFESRIVIFNLRPPNGTGMMMHSHHSKRNSSSVRSTFPPMQLLADIKPCDLNKAHPTSTAVPIASSCNLLLLAIGCSDGTMRFYDVQEGKVVKSVRGPNGRNDPVIKIVPVNAYGAPSATTNVEGDGENCNGDESVSNCGNRDVQRTRVVSVCSTGNAYLWELILTLDTTPLHSPLRANALTKNSSPSAGGSVGSNSSSIEKFKLKPPLIRMEGMSGVGVGSNSGVGRSDSAGGNGKGGTGGANSGNASMNKCNVNYDPDRDFLIWSNISGCGGSARTHVMVWDLSPGSLPNVEGNSTKAQNSPLTPRHDPFMSLHIPTAGTAGANVGSSGSGGVGNNGTDGSGTDTMVVPGMLHPSFPDTAMVCLVGNRNGDLSVFAASCTESSATSPGNSVTMLSSDKGVQSGQVKRAVLYFSTSIASLSRSADQKVLGMLGVIGASKVRVYVIGLSRFRPNMIVMGTSCGVMVVAFEENNALVTGTRHASIAMSVAGAGPMVGVGGTGVHGGGVVLVENSAVFTATLDTGPASTATSSGLVGPIHVKDPVLIYKAPLPMLISTENHPRPIRLPPRLLPSPSGKFLCLFWHIEEKYEILHVGSMVGSSRNKLSKNETDYASAVDTGVKVLSFAWVGDEDVFALLHPPELSKSDLALSMGASSGKDKKGIIKELAKFKSKIAATSISGGDADDEVVRVDPSKYLPRVELKILVGITADAMEISGSIAAATAATLGDVSLRGGLRHPPTCLFGGPALCVGSLTQDGDNAQADGMAYFYCRKQSAADGDIRAPSYAAAGPPLPYPDLVVWDDDGRLCVVIVGRRVAIYCSEAPKFTLLGTTMLGSANEPDATAQSAKFLHGVLFCCTRTSVQCIFMGDMENDDSICEIDSFMLASAEVPAFATSTCGVIPFEPLPFPMRLIRPSILSYHNGSLLVSTVSGIQAVPMSNPLIRIGALLAAGHHTRAQRWFEAVEDSHHEALAAFLDRRGVADLAVYLPGLSLETIIDFSLRYGLTERLEELIETHGLDSIRQIDMGRGLTGEGSHSVVVCVGAFLLSQGKAELVRRLATECMASGEEGRKEAFVLASLLLAVDPSDAKRLVKRAVGGRASGVAPPSGTEGFPSPSSWPVGAFVRDHILN